MRYSKAVIALVAVLTAATSVSAFALGHSGDGGRGNQGSHRGPADHAYSGVRAPAHRAASGRHFGGRARICVFIGAPLYAPLFYPAPSYYYPPPPVYIEQSPTPDYWYFCPELNAYYPYVEECPGSWQPVLPQPPG